MPAGTPRPLQGEPASRCACRAAMLATKRKTSPSCCERRSFFWEARHQLAQMLFQFGEIDRLGEKCDSAELVGTPLAVIVAIGGHHQDRELRPTQLDFPQQLEPIHPGHI